MGISWKFYTIICSFVFLFNSSYGLPLHLEAAVNDTHLQVLTGLLAVILALCGVLLLAGCLCCQNRNGFKEFRDGPVVASGISNLDEGYVNPMSNGEFTIFAPLSPSPSTLQHNNNVFNTSEKVSKDNNYKYGDLNVSSWFGDDQFNFPRNRLKYIQPLGKGWFGQVVEGTAQDIKKEEWVPVAVRILDSTASLKEKVFFLHEAEMYRCDEHSNILRLYGRCLEASPFLLLQEYCPQGDLKSYLIANQSSSENLLVSEYPLIWCCQLTSALKHLHDRNICHQDLASRNCQLTSNLTLKVGDYGLAASKYPEDYYGGSSAISIRWCAPESVTHTNSTIIPKKITKEANVWSLAVCFWEICECGKKPYDNLSDDDVVTQVLGSNVRLPMPTCRILYMDYVYRLITSCWSTPESRPIVSQIYQELTNLLQVYTSCQRQSSNEASQDTFDIRWNALKPNNLPEQDNILNYSIVSSENNDFILKTRSTSLNNLRGSFENLNNVDVRVATTNPSQKLQFMLDVNEISNDNQPDSLNDSSLCNRLERASSSDTEEENWKLKVERGAYSEQVRQKSRSVTDLMVLTHIDYSESESETPLPSLDYRVNYKNVRCMPKNNLENMSLVHGSEGNLIEVEESFHDELKQLLKSHHDGSPVVPEKFSQNFSLRKDKSDRTDLELASSSSDNLISNNSQQVNQEFSVYNVTVNHNCSPLHVAELSKIINLERGDFNDFKKFSKINGNAFNSERLSMRDSLKRSDDSGILLSSSERSGSPNTEDMEDHVNGELFYAKLNTEDFDTNENSNLKDEYLILKTGAVENQVLENIEKHVLKNFKTEVVEDSLNSEKGSFTLEKNENIENLLEDQEKLCHKIDIEVSENKQFKAIGESPTNGQTMEKTAGEMNFVYSVKTKENEEIPLTEDQNITDIFDADYQNELNVHEKKIAPKNEKSVPNSPTILDVNVEFENTVINYPRIEEVVVENIAEDKSEINEKHPNNTGHGVLNQKKKGDKKSEKPKKHLFQVPKLIDIIENNDFLMNYIISNYESELPDDLSCENSLSFHDYTLNQETKVFAEPQNKDVSAITFDLGENQATLMPNTLTHSSVFSMNLEPPSLFYLESPDSRSLNTPPNSDEMSSDQRDDCEEVHNETFTLESKDNSFVIQKDNLNSTFTLDELDDENLATNSSEFFHPQCSTPVSCQFEDYHHQNFFKDGSFEADELDLDQCNETYPVDEDKLNSTFTVDESEDGNWVANDDGWFLHPQSSIPVSGEIIPQDEEQNSSTDFGIDDGLMTAIRNELILKLPHAQNVASSKIENEEQDDEEKNEIFLHYNLYPQNMHLFTIYEEDEDNLSVISQEHSDEEVNESRSSSPNYLSAVLQKEDSHSMVAFESALKESQNSQSSHGSNGSNDTLFDLEELNGNLVDQENKIIGNNHDKNIEKQEINSSNIFKDKTIIKDFLLREKENCEAYEQLQLVDVFNLKSSDDALINIPESMENNSLSNDIIEKTETAVNLYANIKDGAIYENEIIAESEIKNDIYEYVTTKNSLSSTDTSGEYVNNFENVETTVDTDDLDVMYCDIRNIQNISDNSYATVPNSENEKFEEIQEKNTLDVSSQLIPDYVNSLQNQIREELMEKERQENRDDFLGVLGDIRFTGPGDEMMSTPFNDVNDNDDQYWESGSESRSSSSCEFIWKLDDVKTMEKIQEESTSDTSCSEDEGECAEFIPSAWDQYAIPMKSALRSPEKTLEKTDKKTKSVWFKEQKYHCIYEYPREPESPVLQNFEQWRSTSIGSDWFFSLDQNEEISNHLAYNIPFESGASSEFLISSSSRPFDVLSSSSCQFFPGRENNTPDSGLEDSTPGSISEFSSQEINVPTLKQLANMACNKMKQQKEIKTNEILGGLRHTIDKLKLDLPPSPSPYSTGKSFNLDSGTEPVKSRFLVQQVDTPEENEKSKNVSFEALPYKPIQKVKDSNSINRKLKEERGEANLLDSADEDSGIESSTLERRLIIS